MNNYQFPYEKLEVWQEARRMVKDIYEQTKCFPKTETFGLKSQINRSAVSVASNLAEGSGRTSLKDQAHFSQMAYGSLMELSCQLNIACDLGYIENDCFDDLKVGLLKLTNKINALRKSQLGRYKK